MDPRDMNARRGEEGLERPSIRFQRQAGTLDAVLSVFSDLVYLCDRNGVFLYVSPAVARAWGEGRADLIGKTLEDLGLPTSVRAILDAQRNDVFAQGRTRSVEVDWPSQDGTRILESILTPIHDATGKVEAVVAAFRDVSEQRRFEEALRRSEEQYRLLAEHITDLITRHDPDGHYLYVSPACRNLLGYEPEELVGRSPYDLIHPDDRDEVARAHTRVLEEPDIITVTYRIRRKDGAYIWFESTARGVRDATTGAYREIDCSSRDVTARKEAEEKLRAGRELLEAVLDNSTAVIYIKDAEGRYLLVNRWFETLFKITRKEISGKTDYDLFPQERADAFRANDRKVLSAGVPMEFEEIAPQEDGLHTYISIKFPIRDADGLAAVCGISTDITSRIRAEEALRQQSEVLRSILDGMADAVIVADQDEHFLVFNPAAEAMFGIGATETTSDEWSRQYGLYLPDQLTPFPAEQLPLARAVRGEEVNDVEMFVCHPRAPEGIWALINGRPLRDGQGNPRGGVIVCHDITERRRTEQQLRIQNERLHEVAQSERQAHQALKLAESQLVQAEKLTALGQMVAGVAHEVNNPLSYVTNNLAVLRRDLGDLRRLFELYQRADATLAAHQPELFERIKELADRIDTSYTLENLEGLATRSIGGVKRIHKIVRDLRNFARLDESDLEEVDLNESIAVTAEIIRARARDQDVELRLDLEPLPPVVCYAGKINQVVLNLLANAIDASEARGQVVVRTRQSANGVEIEVIDNGHGIDPAIREKIFDPFFTTKPVGKGTGLGLSISHGIVESHGGRIGVESTPGQGSTFTVWLPLVPPTPTNKREDTSD